MSINSSSEFIREIKRHPDRFYIIHYSCQSLYDDNERLSPRITSIAAMHLATEQTVSFSTHAIAEELGISRDQVLNRFDDIERDLLSKFAEFIRDRRDRYWIHWNMRNLTYGFEHIEHRYRTLHHQDAPSVPIERRLNLNDMLSDRYGSDYCTDPKMHCLMELNGGIHRFFLKGEEEVEAFKNLEFIRMHNSTLCKVGFFKSAIQRMVRGQLRTQSRGIGPRLDKLLESRLSKGIALAAGLVGIITAPFLFF
jgi:hypothetical protein